MGPNSRPPCALSPRCASIIIFSFRCCRLGAPHDPLRSSPALSCPPRPPRLSQLLLRSWARTSPSTRARRPPSRRTPTRTSRHGGSATSHTLSSPLLQSIHVSETSMGKKSCSPTPAFFQPAGRRRRQPGQHQRPHPPAERPEDPGQEHHLPHPPRPQPRPRPAQRAAGAPSSPYVASRAATTAALFSSVSACRCR